VIIGGIRRKRHPITALSAAIGCVFAASPPHVTLREAASSSHAEAFRKGGIMLKWLMRKGLASFERKWNYDASYMHELIDADPMAAWKFSKAAGIGTYRKNVPLAAWTAAAITAVRHEDCGPCTQLGVSMAEKSGVDPKVLRAILAEDAAAMPDDVALAWRFTRAALDHDPVVDEYRQEIIRRWGPRAVISLAFAMVASRIYPTVKYAMGHGQTCARVVVDGTPIAFDRPAVSAQRA